MPIVMIGIFCYNEFINNQTSIYTMISDIIRNFFKSINANLIKLGLK